MSLHNLNYVTIVKKNFDYIHKQKLMKYTKNNIKII